MPNSSTKIRYEAVCGELKRNCIPPSFTGSFGYKSIVRLYTSLRTVWAGMVWGDLQCPLCYVTAIHVAQSISWCWV
ncbi:hypothetical protein E2C01_080823 [Portunus trituberculatus]|uniref:Uncharacterized protein n=1 Tax=Portunus trituberculatus TaxID=210409 RepID=A0A5B7INA0_PORTR|nr:hypothetical protein [Portunus trituberculatus]